VGGFAEDDVLEDVVHVAAQAGEFADEEDVDVVGDAVFEALVEDGAVFAAFGSAASVSSDRSVWAGSGTAVASTASSGAGSGDASVAGSGTASAGVSGDACIVSGALASLLSYAGADCACGVSGIVVSAAVLASVSFSSASSSAAKTEKADVNIMVRTRP
jgi:hypothetical protein